MRTEHVAPGMTRADKAKNLKSGHLAMYRRALAEFRARLAEAHAERVASVKRMRDVCRRARRVQKMRLKAYRTAELLRMNAHIRSARAALAAECKHRIAMIQRAGHDKETRIRKEAAERRRIEKLTTSEEQRVRREHAKLRRAGEAARESFDAVVNDIPADLVPVFRSVQGRIKGSQKQTRTEAFLKWAHENPEAVVEIQSRHFDKLSKRDIAELRKQERAMTVRSTKARAPRHSKAEIEGLRRLGIDVNAPRFASSGPVPF